MVVSDDKVAFENMRDTCVLAIAAALDGARRARTRAEMIGSLDDVVGEVEYTLFKMQVAGGDMDYAGHPLHGARFLHVLVDRKGR